MKNSLILAPVLAILLCCVIKPYHDNNCDTVAFSHRLGCPEPREIVQVDATCNYVRAAPTFRGYVFDIVNGPVKGEHFRIHECYLPLELDCSRLHKVTVSITTCQHCLKEGRLFMEVLRIDGVNLN